MPSLPRRRRGGSRDPHSEYGTDGWLDPPYAVDSPFLLNRLRRDFRTPTAERICERVADLSGPAEWIWRHLGINPCSLPGGRCAAGAGRGSRGRLLCEGFRHYV